jgi:hypothetical protein
MNCGRLPTGIVVVVPCASSRDRDGVRGLVGDVDFVGDGIYRDQHPWAGREALGGGGEGGEQYGEKRKDRTHESLFRQGSTKNMESFAATPGGECRSVLNRV